MNWLNKLSPRSNQRSKCDLIIVALLALAFSACIKKSDKNNPSAPVVLEMQNKSIPAQLLEPQPMKLCVRPAHRLGLKKCVRNGKWVRLSIAANDVDNNRTDVFTSPRISLKKENFYADTFRFHDGVNHVANYPDYYHSNAPYGGFAHFIFAMPNDNNLPITYAFAGRDEVIGDHTRTLSRMIPSIQELVKIQHWNDGRMYKKHAIVYFELIGDYSEVNYRHDCGWGESQQDYDYTQVKTKDGVDVPRIPETFIWRKMAEACTVIPSKSTDGKFNYLPFREISQDAITTEHKFTLADRNKIKVYSVKTVQPDDEITRFNIINPMSQPGMKIDGSTTLFMNSRKEEVSRWEALYDEDLKDISFQPERSK